MSEYNVLILSAGRRVELVECFRNAARELSILSKVIAADCSSTAPALYFADKSVKLPHICEPNYVDSIIEVCNSEHISLVVPTIDTDLLLLSKNKDYIESSTNSKLLISDPNVVEICRDKEKTHIFLSKNNFGTAKMYTYDDIKMNKIIFPVFIKPKAGSSSINAYKINNEKELALYTEVVEDPIIQEYLEGDEYSVDVFLDFNCNIITIVPRLRIATRAGEIIKGKIIKDREIINDVARLINILKPIGHITVQLKKTQEGIKYIEINPRFGGGAPMSIKCGADSCLNLYKLLMGSSLKYNEDYKDGITFLRFDNCIMLDESMEIINGKGSNF